MPSRPCRVEISRSAFEENYRFLSKLAGSQAELLAMVKANAYGHSLELCAPAAVRAGARWLGVTSVEEGIEARRLCPDARILVISGPFANDGEEIVRNRLTAVVWDPWHFDVLEAAARKLGIRSVSIHLEIDTGMSRQGVDPDLMDDLLGRFRRDFPLRLEGVMTHLFAADEADGQVTEDQLSRMNAALIRIKAAGIHPGILNVGNSAALICGQTRAIQTLSARYEMKALMRPGLALYGVVPEFDPRYSPAEPVSLTQVRRRLRPVLSWKSEVVSVRSVQPGAVVGYNGTFVATEPMRLALLAVGYGDGLDRRLGNRFALLVRGRRAPMIGRVNMDQAVIDVTDIPDVTPGDEVVLIGQQGEETITAYDHARAAETIPWEIFTRIAGRVPRVAR
jgi:alanine racemase